MNRVLLLAALLLVGGAHAVSATAPGVAATASHPTDVADAADPADAVHVSWWSFPAALAAVAAVALGVVGKLWILGSGALALGVPWPRGLRMPAFLGPLGTLGFLPFVGLFSRIDKDQLLHNPVRKKVSEYVQENPGATIMEVRNALDIAWGTAVYHLDRLERNGELVGERRGNRHRYFQANTPEARHRAGWSTLQQPKAYDLARAIAENPGVHQKSLCEGLGMQNPSASKHLAKLRAAGLVEAQRISRYVVYEPTERLRSTLELMDEQAPGGATDRPGEGPGESPGEGPNEGPGGSGMDVA